MDKALAVLVGAAAWAGVAALALLIVFNIGTKNQVLMVLPIVAAVVIAWGIGEFVTERVLTGQGRQH